MNANDFQQIINARVDSCIKVLYQKQEEYASDFDRLHNFKAAGRMLNDDPSRVLGFFMAKHIVSMFDMIRRMSLDSEYVPSKNLVGEKLGDVINYVLLLEALIEERRGLQYPREAMVNPVAKAWDGLMDDKNE